MKKFLLNILLLSIVTTYTQPILEPKDLAKARNFIRVTKVISGFIGGLVLGIAPVVPVGIGVTICVANRCIETNNRTNNRSAVDKFCNGLIGTPFMLVGAGACGGLAGIGSGIAGASIGAPLGVLIGKKIGLNHLSKKYKINVAELEKMIAAYVPPAEEFQRLPLPNN